MDSRMSSHSSKLQMTLKPVTFAYWLSYALDIAKLV